jgi:hypothetical protein
LTEDRLARKIDRSLTESETAPRKLAHQNAYRPRVDGKPEEVIPKQKLRSAIRQSAEPNAVLIDGALAASGKVSLLPRFAETN